MKQSISIENYNILKNVGMRKVKVNSKDYDCKVGLETDGGFYKNGWTAEEIDGVKGKHKYIRFLFYTSVKKYIDIEEKWLIRDDGKVIKRLGWNDVNLLKFCRDSECFNDMNIICKDFKK